MAFLDSDIDYLSKLNPQVNYQLKIRKPHQNEYSQRNLVESCFALERSINQVCSSITFYTLLRDTDFQVGSEIELWAELKEAGKTERIYSGFLVEQTREWPTTTNIALDRCEIFRRSTAEILKCQNYSNVIENAQLVLVSSAGEGLWGLDGILNPSGFDSKGNRRSWAVAPSVVLDTGVQLAPDSYYTDFTSGLIRIYSSVSAPVLEYCRPLIEGTNDIADILSTIVKHPQSECGAGISSSKICFCSTGIDLPVASWRKHNGSALDAWEQLKRELPSDWWLSYRADKDKFYLNLLEAAVIPRFQLVNIVKSNIRTSISTSATDVIVAGVKDRPDNLACSANVVDLQSGTGEVIRWSGSSRASNPSGSNLLDIWVDTNPNTGLGHASDGYTAGNWYPLIKLDLGSEKMIGELRLTAGNSLNPGALKQDNCDLLPAYKLFGSSDDIDYYPLCANQPIECLPLETVSVSESLLPKLRYITVLVRAYCDTNGSRPALSLNEIGVFEPSGFSASAKAQDEDAQLSNYYPEVLEKTASYGRSLWIEAAGNRYGEVAASKLAESLLKKRVNSIPRISTTTITNPLLELGDTVQLKDDAISYNGRVLVEKITLTPELTRIVGRAIDLED